MVSTLLCSHGTTEIFCRLILLRIGWRFYPQQCRLPMGFLENSQGSKHRGSSFVVKKNDSSAACSYLNHLNISKSWMRFDIRSLRPEHQNLFLGLLTNVSLSQEPRWRPWRTASWGTWAWWKCPRGWSRSRRSWSTDFVIFCGYIII